MTRLALWVTQEPHRDKRRQKRTLAAGCSDADVLMITCTRSGRSLTKTTPQCRVGNKTLMRSFPLRERPASAPSPSLRTRPRALCHFYCLLYHVCCIYAGLLMLTLTLTLTLISAAGSFRALFYSECFSVFFYFKEEKTHESCQR